MESVDGNRYSWEGWPMTYVLLFILIFPFSVFAGSADSACQIPKNSPLNQKSTFPKACSLTSLQLDQLKYVLISTEKPKLGESDYPAIRYIGQPEKGYILEVTAEGLVFSFTKTTPWKESKSLQTFQQLMSKEFSPKKLIKAEAKK